MLKQPEENRWVEGGKKGVLAELSEEGKEMVVLPEDGMENRIYHKHKLGKGHTTYSPLFQVGLQQYLSGLT